MRQRFMPLISSSLKSNSPLLLMEQYDKIVNFLKAEDRKIEKKSTKEQVPADEISFS